MTNFFKILAASVGGGLVLGAGIRLGEAIATGGPESGPNSNRKFAEKVGAVEKRLAALETKPKPEGAPAIGSRFAAQEAELSAIRSRIEKESREVDALGANSLRLRGELRGWIQEAVATQIADVEVHLKMEAERTQQQMLDAVVEGIEARLMHRLSGLEEEVAGQLAAMSELRECSLRNEQSLQKLLGGLDRLIVQRGNSGPTRSASS